MHKLLELVLDFVVHFKILHKMYPCEVAFSKFKDTDNSCIFCNTHDEVCLVCFIIVVCLLDFGMMLFPFYIFK